MAVAASGPISLPLDNLRTLLANSSSFQTWVGAADATEAKAHIYFVAVDPPISSKRPLACVRQCEPAEFEHRAEAGGTRQHYIESGALELYFEAAVASGNADDHGNAELAFTNDVGSFISDMEALAGSGTYLTVTNWSVISGPARAHPDEEESEGDYYQILLRVEWGI